MKLYVLIPVVLVLALFGCDTAPSDVPADPSYAADVQPIFSANCITCHGNSSPSGGYSLTSRAGTLGAGSDTTTNAIPGLADSSKLYRRVMGTETPQMPLGQPALDTVKTITIRNWLNKGTKDN